MTWYKRRMRGSEAITGSVDATSYSVRRPPSSPRAALRRARGGRRRAARVAVAAGANGTASGAPMPSWGVQSGDVSASRAVVWCRSDRPSRMFVEWSTSPAFTDARRVAGPLATPDGDLIAKVALEGLPSSTRIHYRVRFEAERSSDWLAGALSTPGCALRRRQDERPERRRVRLVGRHERPGLGHRSGAWRHARVHRAARSRARLLRLGAATPSTPTTRSRPSCKLEGGGTWKNLVTPAKSHVAETLDDFRGAHLYPRHSPEVRALSANVPTFAIWDDHEVRNNWFPGEVVDEPARREPRMSVIAEHARRAMLEHSPTLVDPARMYRSVRWGPLLEVFFLDGRSFRTHELPRPARTKRSSARRSSPGSSMRSRPRPRRGR